MGVEINQKGVDVVAVLNGQTFAGFVTSAGVYLRHERPESMYAMVLERSGDALTGTGCVHTFAYGGLYTAVTTLIKLQRAQ